MPEENGHAFEKRIDLIAKTAAIALTILYIFGYLVVSLHLAEFGIHSVALLRIQYLTAGFFSLGPLFLLYFAFTLLRLGFEKLFVGEQRLSSFPDSSWPRFRWMGVGLLRILWEIFQILIITGVVIDGMASIFVPGVGRDLLWRHPWLFAGIIRDSAMTVVCILWVRRAFHLLEERERGLNLNTASQIALPLALFLLFFLAYTKRFSHDVYPEIPFAIGGGKPESVVFLLKRDVEAPPVVSDNSGSKSVRYKLILETDRSYAVIGQVTQERAIQFNREAVEGYIVVEDK